MIPKSKRPGWYVDLIAEQKREELAERNRESIAQAVAREKKAKADLAQQKIRISKPSGSFGTLNELQQEKIAPSDYLLAGILPTEGAGMLVGPPFAGKTRLLLQLALAVAAKDDTFLDRKLRHGAVLYLALEMSKSELKQQVRKIAGDEQWPTNFYYATRGTFPDAEHGGLKALHAWCMEHKPVLIGMDTWVKWRVAPSGQSLYDNDYQAIDELRALGAEVGCFILVNHHTGKRAHGGNPTRDVIGTHGLAAGASVMLELTSRGKPGSVRGMLDVTGNAVAAQRIPLALDEKPLCWRIGEVKAGRPDTTKQAAIEFLRKELADGPRRAQELKRLAIKKGTCKLWTLMHAKTQINIKSIGKGTNTCWKLPKAAPKAGV